MFLFRYLIATAATLLVAPFLPAQSPAGGGTIRYTVRTAAHPVPGLAPDSVDKEIRLHCRKDQLRYEDQDAHNEKCDYRQEGWIADFAGRQLFHLSSLQGKLLLQKTHLPRDPRNIAEQEKRMVYTRETRTIAGYPCRKVIYQGREASERAELWVTDRIPLNVSPVYPHLVKGVVMEAKIGFSRYLAGEISFGSPSADLFDISRRSEVTRAIEQKIASACY